MSKKVELFTASYRAFKPEMGLPVRTSNGRPKYALNYVLEYKAPIIYPSYSLMRAQIPMEKFTELYQKDLDAVGVETFRKQFDLIAEHSGQHRLVLLCFEARRSGCHRGSFAEWWERETGEEVFELG